MGSVAEWYKGRSVLVTGGSGLMGKVLVEKLLYSCPHVGNIYILIRPKRGKTPIQRIEEMIKIPLFERVRQEYPENLQKIVGVEGDVGIDGLGLSNEDKQMLVEEVSVVVHAAATLRLDASLKDAIGLNTEGTLRILELCKEMKQLKVVIHMSTAFSHVDQHVMEEKVYPAPADPLQIIDLCHWLEDSALELATPRLLGPHPNSYTYSKRLAEALVDTYKSELPVTIVRPSIVTPAWREPLEGWVDNLNGPVGLLVGGAKGVIRSMHCNGHYNAEVIPVDMAINGIIAVGWKVGSAKTRSEETPVFNLTQSGKKPVTWSEIVEKGKRCAWENPFELMLWYPDGNVRSSKFLHNLVVLFCHWLPAYLIDFLMIIFRQKPFMIKVQTRIQDGLDVLQFFTTRQWIFPNTRLIALRDTLTPEDKETFTLYFERINILAYLADCILGARHYLMKEDPKSLPRARRNLKIFWAVDRLVKLLFYSFAIWMVFGISSPVLSYIYHALPFLPTIKG